MPLRDPLPPIGIPLRKHDADLPLELQPLIDRAGAAFRPFDYDADLDPPLPGDDAAWAAQRLTAAGITRVSPRPA